ncbi:FAD/NAD-P-binding domain-containing protein [Gloeopeniophorella convolvens]|nr:FAD/NAD-P-binding domain-containing protein [Gloeopeniophorella convolvens]
MAPSVEHQSNPLLESVGVIGSGAAGLITAHTLLQDGFTSVEVLTRDKSVGGVWSQERVYSSMQTNSVHGEFRFSTMPMREPKGAAKTGGRLMGTDVHDYLDEFAQKFLKGKIRFGTEILKIRRGDQRQGWDVLVWDAEVGAERTLHYARIVLCTGGSSNPRYPKFLSLADAQAAGFSGPVLHTMHFSSQIDGLLEAVKPMDSDGDADAPIIVVGGGKSAQDAATYFANEGRPVTLVFETAGAVVASKFLVPAFIRKSRLMSVMGAHMELRTRLERFMHTTWLGGAFVRWFWKSSQQFALDALSIPKDSPLRRCHSIFWDTRASDEGIPRAGYFHALVNEGKIKLVAPARAVRFGEDGRSVVLGDGRVLPAAAVVLGTGYQSTWKPIFDDETMADLGLGRHPPDSKNAYHWDYTSLANPPAASPKDSWASSVHRGLVPTKSLFNRDFALNGAVLSPHHTYVSEVSAHWISAYFRHDELRLPRSEEDAREMAERHAAWVRQRYPYAFQWWNESNTTYIAYFSWPQFTDDLLQDMGLRSGRSGGNWLTWPFKAIDLAEIATLKEERDAKRQLTTS